MGYLGGFGSGRYGYLPGQKRPKTTVEECLCLDFSLMHKKSTLTSPNILTASWSYTTADHEDRPVGSISIFVFGNVIKLSYTITDKNSGQQQHYTISVLLEWIPCTYGGTRPYFTCSDCHRRVLKLYRPPSHAMFSCRHCAGLTYRSCQDSGDDHARARARTGRACRKLGIKEHRNCDDARLKVYFLDRPKGMHKKTFERLRNAVFEAVDEEEEAFKQALYAFAERLKRRNRKLERRLAEKVPV